jgi:XTP/dITP diphosphohydrolase
LLELRQLLSSSQVSLHSLAEFTADAAEETGNTFRENALLKARFAASAATMPAIADDSGIEVDALGGAPGVYSARYAGLGATDVANNQKLLAALAAVPDALRTARFRSVLVYIRDALDPEPLFAEGIWEGAVALEPRGRNGFGYDSLFIPQGFAVTSAELLPDEKNRLSHRAQALRCLLRTLVERREFVA